MIRKANEPLAQMAATDKLVEKYGIFDMRGSSYGLRKTKCTKDHPCSHLVTLYAKMGLHRYNLLKGTKFQLKHVKKYIVTTGSAAPSYYMTSVGIDDTAGAGGGSSSLQTFQTQVSQQGRGKFILTCDIARIRGETRNDNESMIIDIDLPEWPAENPFEKYCMVKSELQDNDDWIRLYLELGVAINEPRRGLFNLEIVKVATDVDEGINAKNATFYIRYKDLSKAEDSDCIAIVRRSFDEDTECFILAGKSHPSSELIPKKRKIVGEDKLSAENKRINTGLGEDDGAENQKIVN
ncbi:unnamed protein product [Eruca vesicaria subsp. sativa]|uniref:Uncharacterized protein n=1 Tax=Eruca vesicaria subsp. sativa TaxID=29727 RepID=A0ABC8KJQ6_ERUVS|nr:unnamed protein product [Eruca vesicaria subsp. sativa]